MKKHFARTIRIGIRPVGKMVLGTAELREGGSVARVRRYFKYIHVNITIKLKQIAIVTEMLRIARRALRKT